MPSTVEKRTAAPGLVRELGAAHAASIVIGVVIGSGIFLVPSEMMQAAGSAKLVYLAWILGSISAFSFLMLPGGHLAAAGKLVAIAFVAFVSVVNYVGIRRAGNFQLA